MRRVVVILALGFGIAPVSYSDDLAVRAHATLRQHCFECHGPDKQRGELRLDSLDAALAGGESGEPALLAHNADDSLLVYLVESTDEKERMPSKRAALPPEDIALLRAWIGAGAPWPTQEELTAHAATHWSFVPPSRPAPPAVSDADAVRNDLDRFLIADMERAGLAPAAEADKHALIRRAYLELLGLPPTPAEVDAFIRDLKPDAYERMVDALFASSHYGERQARRWLDLARYADTNGYEKDRPRSIWPYRDWVIRAFNENMPFDEFAIEQLAGDLLPNATESQRVATGFLRNSMFNEEGGIDAAEDWYKRTVDRTNVTGAAFLGLTLNCAQCHDHKFDPVSHREYFGVFAFFNDTGEETIPLHDDGIEAEQTRIRGEIAKAEDKLVKDGRRDPAVRAEFDAWLNEKRAVSSEWTVLRPVSIAAQSSATMIELDDGSILATGDVPNDDVYTLEFAVGDAPITAIRLEALPDESLPGGGPGRGTILVEGDFLLTNFEVSAARDGGDPKKLNIAAATEDFAAKDNGAALALDDRSDTGWSVKGGTAKPHTAVFRLAEPIDPGAVRLRIVLTQDYIHQHVLGRFRVSVTSRTGDVVASGLPADVESATRRTDKTSSEFVFRYYAIEIAPELAESREWIAKLRESVPKLPTTLVMTDRPMPRETHLYHRGEFLSPRDTVPAGVPAVLPPLPADAPLDRLTLARWIVSRENPLAARVTMNRLWQHVFGRGLVTTPEDFGTRGAAPLHPELLDWLAVEFMESGWDLRHMHRLMVTCAAFRRSANVSPDDIQADPENVLLARGPRFRLNAEAVRDLALAASGLLNDRVGGPSVFPPQPKGINELAFDSSAWTTSTGADRYRRGLYTYMKRTAPYAAAITFDAPSGEEICTRRERTTTPLQALTLLNDRVYTEAAQSMARRVLDQSPDPPDTISLAFRLCLARSPDDVESQRLLAYYTQTLQQLTGDPAKARAIAGPLGALHPTRTLPELAAWTMVCRAILNLDETITQG